MTLPNLQAPNRNKEESDLQNKGSGSLTLILTGIIICLLLIIIALLLLPATDIKTTELNINNKNKQQLNSKKSKGIQTPEDTQAFNENSQIEWLVKKKEAEQNKLVLWADKELNQAVTLAEQAREYKRQKNNKQAEKHFLQAAKIIENTLQDKQLRLQELLVQVEHALEKNDPIKAKQLYETAREIGSEEEQIKKKINNLENKFIARELYTEAMEHKKNQQIKKAIISLEKAKLKDPEYIQAKTEWQILIQKQRELVFKNTVTEVLKAIERKDWHKAETGLKKAKEIKNDPIISELETRITEQKKRLAIDALQKKARRYESKEQWHNALNSFDRIIHYDAETAGAKTGRTRVKSYLRLNQMLDSIIGQPQRLQNDDVFKKAKISLAKIKVELEQKNNLLLPVARTPKLAEKINLAEMIINQAAITIPVSITSDNKTDIAIYKIGKFGKLSQKTIILRPGQYTIVGSRIGYRDIRKHLKISPGDKSVTIKVQCQEKI